MNTYTDWMRTSVPRGGVTTEYAYDGDNATAGYTAARTISALYVAPFLD